MAFIFITKGKTNWKYLLIVFVFGIIVGAGSLWFSARQEPSYQPPEIKKSETANWKTYRNEEYKYEVKYPSDWKINVIIDWLVTFTSPSVEKQFSITVPESKMIEEKPPPVCLAGRCSDATFFKDIEITLNNFSGIRREIVYSEFPGPLINIETYILKGKFFFRLDFKHWETAEITPEDTNFYNQMLSTFKFLE
jgi:hypothetical protein